jgi:hypothetical protein
MSQPLSKIRSGHHPALNYYATNSFFFRPFAVRKRRKREEEEEEEEEEFILFFYCHFCILCFILNFSTGPPVTEEEVRKALSQGKRLRTFDLINHFKASLVDEKQRNKLTDITRKMCSIVDEGGVKYLNLKPEYIK